MVLKNIYLEDLWPSFLCCTLLHMTRHWLTPETWSSMFGWLVVSFYDSLKVTSPLEDHFWLVLPCVMIGMTEPWPQFISASEWHLSACFWRVPAPASFGTGFHIQYLLSRMGFVCRLYGEIQSSFFWVGHHFSCFALHLPEVLNASSFRDFLRMRTTIPLKILTIFPLTI